MKKNLCLLAVVVFGVFLSLQAQNRGFIHPGGLHTQADFDTIKAQIVAKEPKVLAAYNALYNWGKSIPDSNPGATVEIVRGSTNNTGNAAYRIKLAYKYALLWKLTDDTRYANAAVKILNGWAAICKKVTGDTNAALAYGIQGYQFAQVGEIMRDYEGWNATDFKNYQQWMLNVFYPGIARFLYNRNGQCPGGYWANWGLCNALAMISIGILCDDVYIYNTGLSFYKYDVAHTNSKVAAAYKGFEFRDYSYPPYDVYPAIMETSSGSGVYRDNGYNEYLGNLVTKIHLDERGPNINGSRYLGQMQEFGRDQGHANMCVGMAADICQTAWSQGDDLWGWMDNRLAAGLECIALYNSETSVDDIPFTPYHYMYDNSAGVKSEYTMKGPSNASRGHYRPVWYRIIAHYEGVKGIGMTYSHKMAESNKSALDEMTGVDHLGLTHLTSIRKAVNPIDAPIKLTPQIEIDGAVLNVSSYINLPVGKNIILMPQLPDSVSGGTWLWDMGADENTDVDIASQYLTIMPTVSNIYRVIYTAANGAKSMQMFSISVNGDCHTDVISRHFYVSHPTNKEYDGWKNEDEILVERGSTTTLSCQAGSNTGNWRYYVKNDRGQPVTINEGTYYIERNTTIYVEYTNSGGGVSLDSVCFVTPFEPILMEYSINNGSNQIVTSSIAVSKGDNITLKPSHSQASSWLWDTGETDRSIQMVDVQGNTERSVTLTTIDGSTIVATYIIHVFSVNTLAEGNYYIKDVSNGLYLTNNISSNIPTFGSKINNKESQVWRIAKDGSRYKITSLLDNRFLNEYALFGTGSYYSSWNTYMLYGVEGEDLYAIRNAGSSGTHYWTINSDKAITGKGSPTMRGFPFEIVLAKDINSVDNISIGNDVLLYPNPVQDYLIVQIVNDRVENILFYLYSINGMDINCYPCKNGENIIQMSQLPSGLYLGVLNVNGDERHFKIIKK